MLNDLVVESHKRDGQNFVNLRTIFLTSILQGPLH